MLLRLKAIKCEVSVIEAVFNQVSICWRSVFLLCDMYAFLNGNVGEKQDNIKSLAGLLYKMYCSQGFHKMYSFQCLISPSNCVTRV